MTTKRPRTKIIFTIGPASEDEATLEALIRLGVDICRVNMAHSSHEWTRTVIRRLKQVCEQVGRQVPVMMDVKGPEVRTGVVAQPINLQPDDTLYLVIEEAALEALPAGAQAVTVNYPGIVDDLQVGDAVLVDSGLIVLQVTAKAPNYLACRVRTPGQLTSRRHVNLPGVYVDLPAITEKDKADIQVGIAEGVAFFALSFVRTAADVAELRHYLTTNGSEASIVAKLEDQCGVRHLEDIIEASDGLMIARGDLGVECPFEQLPAIQKKAIELSILRAKPVIVATHMLESMIHSPVPTRAEVTDIANAVYERADCIMLSGETSQGRYPLECVKAMQRIACQVEDALPPASTRHPLLVTPKAKLLSSAVDLAQQLGHAALFVFTKTGQMANLLTALRSTQCRCFCFTDNPAVLERMRLMWGIEPILMPLSESVEKRIQQAIEAVRPQGWLQKGDSIVVLPHPTEESHSIETLQLLSV